MLVEDTSPKAALYEGFALVGKALGNPARIELLNLLAQGERGAGELAAAAGVRLSNTPAPVSMLAGAGLVTARRSGTHVFYRLASPQVTVLAELAKQVACDRLPQVREAARAWLGDTGELEPVTRAELGPRLPGPPDGWRPARMARRRPARRGRVNTPGAPDTMTPH